MKKVTKVVYPILGIAIITFVMMFFNQNEHGHDVKDQNMISHNGYKSCINFLIADETIINKERFKQLAIDCSNTLTPELVFIKNVEGDLLIFINDDDYYRVKPSLIVRLEKKLIRTKLENSDWFNDIKI
jgi:hypothetical protein